MTERERQTERERREEKGERRDVVLRECQHVLILLKIIRSGIKTGAVHFWWINRYNHRSINPHTLVRFDTDYFSIVILFQI